MQRLFTRLQPVTRLQHALRYGYALVLLVLMAALGGCDKPAQPHSQHQHNNATPHSAHPAHNSTTTPVASTGITLDVYKSPSCGCCTLWIDHIEANGIHSVMHHPDDLNEIKNRYGILPVYQSCHTAVSSEGYVFEGHIPAHVLLKFLAEKPEGAIGLAVAGMPLGSPGMELHDRITPYDVLLLKKDGSSEVYAHIDALVDAH